MKKSLFIPPLMILLSATLGLSVQATEVDHSKVQERLQALLPGETQWAITTSPLEGVAEVMVGPKVLYISNDGRFLLQGEIFDLESEKNLTEARQNQAQADALKVLGEETMVSFGDPDLPHTVTIFTDIDCGYCRKLHDEMGDYNKAGIRVRYLFFPRAAENSPSWNKAVSVWCAGDAEARQEAMTKAKAGETIPTQRCPSPVAEHVAMGQLMGVRGTPAIILEDGRMVPGYIPAARLSQFLENSAN